MPSEQKQQSVVKIHDKDIPYALVRRRVRYPRIEYKREGFLVILPEFYRDAESFINRHRDWMYKTALAIERLKRLKSFFYLEERTGPEEFKGKIRDMAEAAAKDLGVQVHSVVFRRMRARWGTCYSPGKIIINSLLQFLPDHYMEYIVFHEVLHRKYRGHGKMFRAAIARRFPDWRRLEQEMRAYWLLIQEKFYNTGEKGKT